MNTQDWAPFRMDWLDHLAVQRTLKSLVQHHSSKASILQRSAFFIVQISLPSCGEGLICDQRSHPEIWNLYFKFTTSLIQHIKKQRHYLSTKVRLVTAMVFPVVTYGCESWTIKKAEHWTIDVFELWCWKRLLRVPWPPRKSNQSILKEINPEYSLEGLMLKLKLQYFGHLMQRADSFEKTLRLKVGEEDDRGWDGWMASLTQWTWVWVNSGSWWWTGRPGVLQFMGSQRVGHNWATEVNAGGAAGQGMGAHSCQVLFSVMCWTVSP